MPHLPAHVPKSLARGQMTISKGRQPDEAANIVAVGPSSVIFPSLFEARYDLSPGMTYRGRLYRSIFAVYLRLHQKSKRRGEGGTFKERISSIGVAHSGFSVPSTCLLLQHLLTLLALA